LGINNSKREIAKSHVKNAAKFLATMIMKQPKLRQNLL